MSAAEDVRNVLQDFLAPELRDLRVRIENVERQVLELKGDMKGQFQQVQVKFQEAERRAERRHDELSFLIHRGLEVKDLAERLAGAEETLKETRH